MEILYLPNKYGQLLDSLDDPKGQRVTWVVARQYYDDENIPARKAGLKAHRTSLVNHMLCLLNMWVNNRPITNSAEILRALDPTVEDHPEATDYVQYSINICPIFGLPGDNPEEELGSIRKMLDTIKGHLDWFVEQNPDNIEEACCQFFNSRSTPVNQSVEFRWGEGLLDDSGNERMRAATQELHDMIAGDPNLIKYMTWLRRQFNSMGSYSWWTIKQDYFYDDYSSPSSERFHRLFKGPTWPQVEKLRDRERKTLK